MNTHCPHCNKRISVAEVTSEAERRAGLIYLSSKCIDCDARFESSGEGMSAAVHDLQQALRRRVGTPPQEWKIKPRPIRKRKKR